MMNEFLRRASEHTFARTLDRMVAAQPYRADLRVLGGGPVAASTGDTVLRVAFNASYGYPTEEDAIAIVAAVCPVAEVDHERTWISPEASVINIALRDREEVIPIRSRSEIPRDFVQIASNGVYRRASDNSIWDLQLSPTGTLALYRREAMGDEMSPVEGSEGIDLSAKKCPCNGNCESGQCRCGPDCNCGHPHGRQASLDPRYLRANFRPGEYVIVAGSTPADDIVATFQRFDEAGRPVVAWRGQEGPVSLEQLRVAGSLDLDGLKEYYTKAYGSAEYAQALVNKMGRK